MNRSYHAIPRRLDVPSSELAAALGLPRHGPATPRLVIGRREWLRLPTLGIGPLIAKTDSGARTSSIHAENVILSPDEATVTFTTRDQHQQPVHCHAPVARFGHVRSSNGIARRRIFIHTDAQLPGGFLWPILLSLSDRSEMLCPLLLGRRALSGYFLIDPQSSRLLGKF